MSPLLKDNLREIKGFLPRFLSIVAIVMLGVAFFVGIKAASPTMLETTNTYYQTYKMPDGRILSTHGVTDEDVTLLEDQGLVTTTLKSVETEIIGSQESVKLFTYNGSDQDFYEVVEGHLPTDTTQIALDAALKDSLGNFQIGDIITLEQLEVSQEAKDFQELFDEEALSAQELTTSSPQLTNVELEVVGYVNTPIYFDRHERGLRANGKGSLHGFGVVHEESVDAELATEIYYWLKNADSLSTYSQEYKHLMEKTTDELEELVIDREQSRNAAMVADMNLLIETLQSKVDDGKAQIADGQKEVDQHREQLNQMEAQVGAQALKEQRTELNAQQEELKTHNAELNDALTDIKHLGEIRDDLDGPTYYVQDRTDFIGYESVQENADKLTMISNIFPVFFFAIAVLVTWTTIKRMAQEQRNYMGTMKQLGYANYQILSKFLIYAGVASILGAILGNVVGLQLFPRVILQAYDAMYHFGQPELVYSWPVMIIVGLIGVLCAVVPALTTPLGILREVPAALLLPEPPKEGRQILLEKINWLWERLGFNLKMSLRNIFRYGGRSAITIFGVAGCTMLILTGFGISDSLETVTERQYEEIQHYDVLVQVADSAIKEGLYEDLDAHEDVDVYAKSHTLTGEVKETNKITQQVSVVVPLETGEKFDALLTIRDQEGQALRVEDGPIISENLIKYLEKDLTEDISLIIDDDTYEFSPELIAETYIGHQLYFSVTDFEETFDSEAEMNTLYVKLTKDGSLEDFIRVYGADNRIDALIDMTHMQEAILSSLGSLDLITLVLIISAAGLAFVVLYNLLNINISERLRELSTIKVLGFYDYEVSLYIYYEIILLTFVGSLVGLGAGYFLTGFILSSMSLNEMLFGLFVNPNSYVWSVIITLIFATLLMMFMYLRMRHIDMVEALKAVE